MCSQDSNPNHELEAELRAVPIPDGLLERLRRTALADDAGLDALVREVPLPPRLAVNIRAAIFDDDTLDEALRDVPLPAGLLARARCVAVEDDDGLDEALRDVPVPSRLAARLAAVRQWRGARFRRAPLVTGVAWFLVVAGCYLAAVVGFLSAMRPQAFRGVPLDDHVTLVIPDDRTAEPPLIWEAVPAPPSFFALRPPAVAMPAAPPLESVEPSVGSAFDEAMDLLDHRMGRTPVDPMLNIARLMFGKDLVAFRGVDEFDDMPDLKKVAGPVPQGLQPPWVPGFPLQEFEQTGFFPFIVPAAHARLQSWPVPLGTDTASYELTRRYLEDGELPPPNRIRTEEFLAAMKYAFPPPKRAPLGIAACGGPSPFGGEGLTLLQVGVQAAGSRAAPHAPRHLVLAVDLSASMRWGSRIEMVRRALADFARRIGRDDRLSLVTFSDEARLAFSDATVDEADAMTAMFAALPVGGRTDLGAGLAAAYGAAHENLVPERATHVVLLSDGANGLGAGACDLIEHRVAGAAPQIRLDVIDLNQGAVPDRQLAAFAQAGRGAARRAVTAEQIVWALLEDLTDQPQLVAKDVRMTITFNLKTVIAYRPLGNEPSVLGKLFTDRATVDFHAGQAASGLFELRLTTGGAQDIASVDVSWQPPDGGPRQHSIQKITRKDFATTFGTSASSLQLAALAARTAELLRSPRFGRGVHPFAEVLQVAQDADTELVYRPCFNQLISLLQEADKARPARSGPRR